MRACAKLLPVLLLGLLLPSCGEPAERQQTSASAEPPAPVLPAADPPLDRRALLLEIGEAASSAAAGRDDLTRQRALNGKPFRLHLRFGCPGEASGNGTWRYDEQERTLSFRVEPQISSETPLIQFVASQDVESVEGFWIMRPWMFEPGCPVTPPAAATADGAAPADGQQGTPAPVVGQPRIGIAQFYSSEDSRTHRRGNRPFAATIRLQEGETPSPSGYDLVLSGRLSALADGRVVACVPEGSAVPPACVVSAQIDHVAIQSAEGVTVAEWSDG